MTFVPIHRERLRHSLQMAVLDLDEGHAPDPFRYADYNLVHPSFLERIQLNLQKGFLRPSPPLELTFPKSEFAVRPGRRIELEDLVVLYYCLIFLIADLEDKLRFGVTAYRIRREKPPRVSQRATLILPRYLRRQLRIIDPWYDAWPSFIQRLRREYSQYERKLVGTSDITSFYEDVDLDLLRDTLRSRVRKPTLPFVNMLIEMYQGWAARDVHLVRQNRGLPQGTHSSGVVANYYLMPFDDALHAYARRKNLRWYRYNDDMRLLGVNRDDVQVGLRSIGYHLGKLNLIQQGSKTKILEGTEARRELFDRRPDKIEREIRRLHKRKQLSLRSRMAIISRLDKLLATLKEPLTKNDSRVLAMLYAAYGALQSDRLLVRWKRDYLREPTRTRTVLGYVARFLERPGQCRAIVSMLSRQRRRATDWEVAQFLRSFRQMNSFPAETPALLRTMAHSKTTNWYVRQQAILTIGWFRMIPEARSLSRILDTEWDDEVRRGILTILFLLSRDEERELLSRASRDLSPKVSRMANYLLQLRADRSLAEMSLRQFKEPNDIFFCDSFWRLYQIRWNEQQRVREMASGVLTKSREHLRGRFAKIHARTLCRSMDI